MSLGKQRQIVFTGGGTAGHVLPNLILADALRAKGWTCAYIGSYDGMEARLVTEKQLRFYAIPTGKLRRYWSVKNFTDPWRIVAGIAAAWVCLRQVRPQLVFSKGGFVAFPVVVAAWALGIPVVAHESDLTPGLANRLSFPFLQRLCVNFTETRERHYPRKRNVMVTGIPLRRELLQGCADRGFMLCRFEDRKPTLLVMGGSAGSVAINHTLREALPQLLLQFNVIHLCGKHKYDAALDSTTGYCQFEYRDQELGDLIALADVVVTRSGANTVFEIMALAKPHVFVPLSRQVSRGDQLNNANFFLKKGVSDVIYEEDLSPDRLVKSVFLLSQRLDARVRAIRSLNIQSGTERLLALIESLA